MATKKKSRTRQEAKQAASRKAKATASRKKPGKAALALRSTGASNKGRASGQELEKPAKKTLAVTKSRQKGAEVDEPLNSQPAARTQKASRNGAAKPASAPKLAKRTSAARSLRAPAKKANTASAQAPERLLTEGAVAPSFELPDQAGERVSSESLAGLTYVLYFYPKNDTPGCTREACGFRDEFSSFEGSGVRIIGVSPDKPESHAKFVKKYGLNFTLLSDVDHSLAEAYGAWTLKKNYGREYMGINRSTFLVGPDGRVAKAWRNVKVNGHVDAVLQAARALD